MSRCYSFVSTKAGIRIVSRDVPNSLFDRPLGVTDGVTLSSIIDGPQGLSGKDGKDGQDGRDGPQGLPGKDGKDGRDGPQGLQGKDGKDGPQGLPGKDGKDGKDGPQGLPGKDGKDGPQGLPGKDGKDGPQGLPGKDGKDGPQGLPGKDGKDGPQGLPGKDGQDGPQGLPGKDGQDGPQGLPGKDGKDGQDGPQGLPGKDGKDGQDGKDGPQGLPGKDGQDGPQGPSGPPGRQGPRGADGATGPQGPPGQDGVVTFPIFAPHGDMPMFTFTGTTSGVGYSDNGELLLIKDGIPKFKIGKDYVDLCNCLSQVKHKKLIFEGNTTIFTLRLTSNSSYMVNIRAIVSKGDTATEKSDAYYQGIATITVDGDGDVHLNVPSESVFSSGFSWKWKIGPNLVEFVFSGDDSTKYSASGRLDILSNGDTSFQCF